MRSENSDDDAAVDDAPLPKNISNNIVDKNILAEKLINNFNSNFAENNKKIDKLNKYSKENSWISALLKDLLSFIIFFVVLKEATCLIAYFFPLVKFGVSSSILPIK